MKETPKLLMVCLIVSVVGGGIYLILPPRARPERESLQRIKLDALALHVLHADASISKPMDVRLMKSDDGQVLMLETRNYGELGMPAVIGIPNRSAQKYLLMPMDEEIRFDTARPLTTFVDESNSDTIQLAYLDDRATTIGSWGAAGLAPMRFIFKPVEDVAQPRR